MKTTQLFVTSAIIIIVAGSPCDKYTDIEDKGQLLCRFSAWETAGVGEYSNGVWKDKSSKGNDWTANGTTNLMNFGGVATNEQVAVPPEYIRWPQACNLKKDGYTLITLSVYTRQTISW